MEVGSQTEPMDRQDILNLLRQKSFELEKKTGVSCGDQDEIHSVEIIDGDSHFNSHNEDTTGAGLRKNSQAVGKQLSSKKSSKAGHPLEQPSLADMICDAVWSRKGSFNSSPGPSRSSSKKSRLVRSQSFSKGSSSTSSSLSPTKAHPTDGSTNGTGGIPTTSGVCMDPYARRPSGAASYILRSAGNRPHSSASREHLPTSSPKFDSRVRRSQGDIDINRQISATLSIPSRENSVKSCSSKSTSGQISPVVITPPSNTSYGYGYSPTNHPNVMIPAPPNAFSEMTPHFYRGQVSPGSSNCLTPITHGRGSRSSSIAQSGTGSGHQHQFREEFEDHIKQKRQRKYVVVGFTFLLIVAVACVVISLGLSSRVTPPGSVGVDTVELVTVVQNYTDDQEGEVRKENENLMRVIQHTSPSLNLTNTNNVSTPVPPPPLLIDDQDESSGNYNNNNNNNFGGSSLTRSVITVDPGPGPLPKVGSSLERDMGIRSQFMRNESESPTTNSSSFTFTTTNPAPIPLAPLDFDRDRDESGTLSSSLIADILLSSSGDRKTKTRVDKAKNKFPVENVMMQDAAVPLGNSETYAETPYTEQIISDSDIDENEYDRVRTSIVLR